MHKDLAIRILIDLVGRGELMDALGPLYPIAASPTYLDDAEFGRALIDLSSRVQPLLVAREEAEGEALAAIERQLRPLTVGRRMMEIARAHTLTEIAAIVEMCQASVPRVG